MKRFRIWFFVNAFAVCVKTITWFTYQIWFFGKPKEMRAVAKEMYDEIGNRAIADFRTREQLRPSIWGGVVQS